MRKKLPGALEESKMTCLKLRSFACLAVLAVFAALVVPVRSIAEDLALTLAERIRNIKEANSTNDDTTSGLKTPTNLLYNQMLKSVALIDCTTEDGSSWSGTGWVLDAKQRLLVTNHHVVEGVEECDVYFPEFIDGQLVTDPARSVVPSRAIHGRVIDCDETCDLAIIQVDRLPKDCPALELAEASATPGQTIHSIAGSATGTQSLWVYSIGHVRQIVRGVLANDQEAMLLESDMATNQGNSGGPVCDDKGRVVAVVEGHSTEARLVSIYVELQSLASYLAEGLRCVDPKTVEDLQFAAERCLESSRPDAAFKMANAALELNRKSADLYALRGWCWYEKDDLESAKGDFEDALKLDDKCADAHSGMGQLAFDDYEYEDSIQHCTTALRIQPENVDYLVQRGQAREWNGEFADARKDYVAALKINPESAAALRGRSIIDIELGDLQAGLTGLNSIISEYNTDAETFYYAGRAMNGLGQFDDAAIVSRRAIELDQEFAGAYQQLGNALVGLEQYDEAADVLTTAIELNSEDAVSHFLMGVIMTIRGSTDEATSYLETALELAEDDEELQASVEELLNDLRSS